MGVLRTSGKRAVQASYSTTTHDPRPYSAEVVEPPMWTRRVTQRERSDRQRLTYAR